VSRPAKRATGRFRDPDQRHDAGRSTAFIAVLALAWGAGLATQYVAARSGYAQQLGSWLYRAPETSRQVLHVALATGGVAVVTALLIRGRRWASLPLALATATIYAVLDGPIYAPTGVLRWYGAHGTAPVDRGAFRIAWIIIVGSVVLVTTAAHRLGHPSEVRAEKRRRPKRTVPPSWPHHAKLGRGISRYTGLSAEAPVPVRPTEKAPDAPADTGVTGPA
jgi:hypothetical protein